MPGEDVVVAVGVPANSAFALFVAGCSVGIGFAVSMSDVTRQVGRDIINPNSSSVPDISVLI